LREREREESELRQVFWYLLCAKCAVLIPAATDCGTFGREKNMILIFGSLNA